MLALAEAETPRPGGRLKIFFGAAPGVGKTYSMLEAARQRRAEGVDVLVGWVETHGRAETAALLEGLERLPPRPVEYRGLTLNEFDLEGALARRPELILVDELAHTNAPGSRHSRRWQDIEELLDNGINVYTTVNVQHLESQTDVVAMMTGVVVQETIPDALLDRAADIELVDLPPEELLQRLRDGKVYLSRQIQSALDHFFTRGNLTLLRELALRKTTDRVQAEVSAIHRRGETGPALPTRGRLLVTIDARRETADLVRSTFRLALRTRTPWLAVAVESPSTDRQSENDKERLAGHLALAQRLGAETLVVRGDDPISTLLTVARDRQVTQIVTLKPVSRWWEFWRRPLARLLEESGHVDVLLVTPREDESAPPPLPPGPPTPLGEYPAALVPIGLATLVCFWLRPVLWLPDLTMIYIAAILVTASRHGMGPSIMASIVSVAAYDFFFIPPFYTLAVGDFQHVLTFGIMLVVAIAVSRRTIMIRRRADEARERERRSAALFTMTREFAAARSVEEIARTAVRSVRDLLGAEAFLITPRAGQGLSVVAGEDVPVARLPQEEAVARWVIDHGRPAGRTTDTLPGAGALYLPLATSDQVVGVLGVVPVEGGRRLAPATRQLLETFSAQAALAIARTRLVEEAAESRLAVEREETRNALLSAVSHDLRTPLASIEGSASVLLEAGEALGPVESRGLLETIHGESRRLTRLVTDLLHLTRLESGSLKVAREPVPVDDLIHSVRQRMENTLAGRPIHLDLPGEEILLPVDASLFEQVLINLLDNSTKYSPAGSPIDIRVEPREAEILLEVLDRGPGFGPGEEEKIFERFYRGSDQTGPGGTGLGLAVCRAIVRAHGGRMEAANRAGGGAVFRIRLPRDADPPSPRPERSS